MSRTPIEEKKSSAFSRGGKAVSKLVLLLPVALK